MPRGKTENRVVRSFQKRYGRKRGKSIFYAKVNKGGRFARAMGKGAKRAARSGGQGRSRHR